MLLKCNKKGEKPIALLNAFRNGYLVCFSHGVQYDIITNSNIFCTVQIVCKQVKVKDKRIDCVSKCFQK